MTTDTYFETELLHVILHLNAFQPHKGWHINKTDFKIYPNYNLQNEIKICFVYYNSKEQKKLKLLDKV